MKCSMTRLTGLCGVGLSMLLADAPGAHEGTRATHMSPLRLAGRQIPGRDRPERTTGTARIRGRVVAAHSGQPLRKARVIATSADERDRRATSTDTDGRFELRELPAGRYRIEVTKGGFVSMSYGQSRPLEAGKPIEVAESQIVEKVNFALPAGGVITGRVLDEFGEPVTDLRVVAMRYRYVLGRRQLVAFGRHAATNDIGEYRIFGLPPGQYLLAALQTGAVMGDPASDDRSGYAPTYYPGTPDAAQAQPVTLETGQALTNIDMPLVPARTARVSGTATDAGGQPLSGAPVVVVQRSGGTVLSTTGTQVRSDGSFTISNLAPGEYFLRALNPGSTGGRTEMASAQITVAGEDVSDVRLTGMKPAIARGRVIVEAAAARTIPPSSLRVITATPRPEDDVFGALGGEAQVSGDYTFELKAPPGPALIRAELPPAWALKTVRHNGSDVTDAGIELRPGEEIGGIEIELTNRVTEVSGTVSNSRGDALRDYTVIVFSTDRDRWGYMSRFFRTGRPDQNGQYKVRALPPGEYHAVAVDYVEPGQASDPEVLERARAHATPFRLSDGETKTLHLKVWTLSWSGYQDDVVEARDAGRVLHHVGGPH